MSDPMNFQTWSTLSADEQRRRCQSLDPYKAWRLLKAVEAEFMTQHGDVRGLAAVFCGYADQKGPGLAINVFLGPDVDAESESSIPTSFMGFPTLCLRRAAPGAALKPPSANGPSLRALLDADEREPLEPAKVDDALWLLLSEKFTSIEAAEKFPRPVVLYVASRSLQWEVGNGGFAQAAYNIPEWFALAAEGYEALGKLSSAKLIRDAIGLLPAERAALKQKRLLSASIERVFGHFKESRMAQLDARIVEADWYVDDARVAYVRHHRDAFRSIPG